MKRNLSKTFKLHHCAPLPASLLSISRASVGAMALLASLLLTPCAGKAQNTPSWTPWGQKISYLLYLTPGPGKNSIETTLTLYVYKSPMTNDGLDWYLVSGSISQCPTGTAGWYGQYMDLDIAGHTQDWWGPTGGQNATLFDGQPATTVLQDSSTFSIGASLGLGSVGPTAGFSLGWTLEADSPGVVSGTTLAANEANFDFIGPQNAPLNITDTLTEPVSAIFSVPHGKGLFLRLIPTSQWALVNTQDTYSQTFTGYVVADFGAAPIIDPRGPAYSQPSTGPQIVAMSNGQCMTAGAPASVTMEPCIPGNKNQEWYYTALDHIVSVERNQCLDIYGQAPASGAQLFLNDCNSDSSQAWQLTSTPPSKQNSSYVLSSQDNALTLQDSEGYVVTVPSMPGANLVLSPPLTSANQYTSFYLQ